MPFARSLLPPIAAMLIAALVGPAVAAVPKFADGLVCGNIDTQLIRETSGIGASRNNPGVLWVHNDSDGPPQVFAVNTQGEILGTYRLTGARALDYEDIALGPGPTVGVSYLYIGDIGDNYARRRRITVYRVAEPVVYAQGGDQSRTLDGVDPIELEYPDGPHDAETLLSDPTTGDLYIITKHEAGNRIYRAPAPGPGSQTIVLEYKGRMSWPIMRGMQLGAVAGDVSPDGGHILIKNYGGIFLYSRPTGTTIWDALIKNRAVTSVA